MASHAQIEAWWTGRRCTGPLESINVLGRYPVRVQPELADATREMDRVLRAAGYPSPTGPTGSYNCRYIGGTTTWSLHAYAVAVDIDYGNNPYLRGVEIPKGFGTDPRFKLTEAQVDAVEGILNDRGEPIWRWLGWTIGDTMHFQVDQPPDRCQPATIPQEDDVIKHGDRGPDVAKFQSYLNRWTADHTGETPIDEDGIFGERTLGRCESFQRWAAVEVNGQGNLITLASLVLVIKPDYGD